MDWGGRASVGVLVPAGGLVTGDVVRMDKLAMGRALVLARAELAAMYP